MVVIAWFLYAGFKKESSVGGCAQMHTHEMGKVKH